MESRLLEGKQGTYNKLILQALFEKSRLTAWHIAKYIIYNIPSKKEAAEGRYWWTKTQGVNSVLTRKKGRLEDLTNQGYIFKHAVDKTYGLTLDGYAQVFTFQSDTSIDNFISKVQEDLESKQQIEATIRTRVLLDKFLTLPIPKQLEQLTKWEETNYNYKMIVAEHIMQELWDDAQEIGSAIYARPMFSEEHVTEIENNLRKAFFTEWEISRLWQIDDGKLIYHYYTHPNSKDEIKDMIQQSKWNVVTNIDNTKDRDGDSL